MSLRKSSITWNCNTVAKMIKSERISFENIIQRSYVWEKSRKSKLIESMIIGYPIPPIYAKRGEDKTYDVLDGKQRLSAIEQFLNDAYELSGVSTVIVNDVATDAESSYEVEGKRFSELPEEVQEIIKSFSVNIYYFDDITVKEEREMFKRLNAGKPLSTKERNIANCTDIDNIIDIGKHEVFSDMFTEKAMQSKKNVPVVIKAYMMISRDVDSVSFASKDFNPVIENTIITDEWKEKLVQIFTRYRSIYRMIYIKDRKTAKKILKETHLVSLVPFINQSIDVDEKLVEEWIISFYDRDLSTSISPKYDEACKSGSARTEKIIKRHEALKESFDKFFKLD